MPETPEMQTIAPDQSFRFACHRKVPCFNQCCRDLNQVLTPYDVVQLKKYLNLSSQKFVDTYAVVYTGAATGLPVASLRFGDNSEKKCPFVTHRGCSVYPARPSSCRIYPLARALRRNRADGRISETYAIFREAHCRGFEEPQTQTVRQWVADQQLQAYLRMNDMLMELIALKNQTRPGPLTPAHRELARMAFYDLDKLQTRACQNALPEMYHDYLSPLPNMGDDSKWLEWSLLWIGQVLFGKRCNGKTEGPEAACQGSY